jgi:hypothetical protein
VFKRPRWFIALAAGALVLVVVATAAYLLLPPLQTSDVAVPPRNAPPEKVVMVYIDALNAHDCETAQALMIEAAKDSAAQWCKDVASLTSVDVHDHFMEPPQASGHSARDEVANVPVTFNLSWRPFHDDGSMDEGATTWGYLLMRGSSGSAWRIFDQGTG